MIVQLHITQHKRRFCEAEIALGCYSKPGVNSDAVNEIAEKHEVAKKFLEFYKQG